MDEVDKLHDCYNLYDVAAISKVREQAGRMPKGVPGECKFCDKYTWRLVGGVCAPCRDLHKLP